LTDTALHVLKGAIVKVLGERAALTTSVGFLGKCKAELIVQLSEKPSEQDILNIQNAANDKIKEKVNIIESVMKRAEAEERYKNKVNHTFIYDKFPVPASITELNIIEIPEWNVNCCKGPHVKNTSDLGALLILQNKFRPKKNEWEIKFIIGQDALDELQSGTKKTTQSR